MKKQKQMKLFNVPEIKSHRSPLYYAEIIEGPEVFVYWKRAWSEAQAKKLAAREHNKKRGFCDDTFVKFGKVKRKE